MSDLRTEARAASRGGEGILAQLRRIRDRILGRGIDAQRLFFGDDGKLRAGAPEWLDRLARENFVRTTVIDPRDRDQTLVNEGRRQLALEILGSVDLDVAELDRINAQIRENEHGR
jgi:hypothetical protein